MSSPRAATSVAISTSAWPERKRAITRSRWVWLRSPWIASAARPAKDDRRAGRLRIEQPGQRLELVARAHVRVALLDLRYGDPLRRDLDRLGLTHVPLGE